MSVRITTLIKVSSTPQLLIVGDSEGDTEGDTVISGSLDGVAVSLSFEVGLVIEGDTDGRKDTMSGQKQHSVPGSQCVQG